MTIDQNTTGFKSLGNERALLEQEIDAYQAKAKLPEPSSCPQCGAVFHQGFWQWGSAANDEHSIICPACHRINDNVPAGFITLEGKFLKDHHEDIIHLIRNHEQHQRAEHPLKRIMDIERIENNEDGLLITTTDIHLAKDIGEALRHAYQGELEIKYTAGERFLRVHWRR
jgi:NMD protein affecting ribosome stability and mRNA decay